MHINRVLIENIRNLDQVSLDELSMLNFFIGPNGAGKTSLLEAISLVSQGRSFRNAKIQTVINQHKQELSVFIDCTDDNGYRHKLGISRDKKSLYQVRVDGVNVSTLAELSMIFPTLVLDAHAFDLLDGPSSVRRKFIDWGVIHVEHGFYQVWKSFNRVLKQRNSLLRLKKSDYTLFEPWDIELVRLSEQIERCRLNFIMQFHEHLLKTIDLLDAELAANTIYYINGWGIDKLDVRHDADSASHTIDSDQLLEALKAQFPKDCKYQRTHIGPHRADILIRCDRQDVKDIYSRGQKKTLVAAMKLAQAEVVNAVTHKKPVLLLDDLPSELDDSHLQRFLDHVAKDEYQCFITAVDQRIFNHNRARNARMFHVERGKITLANAPQESRDL